MAVSGDVDHTTTARPGVAWFDTCLPVAGDVAVTALLQQDFVSLDWRGIAERIRGLIRIDCPADVPLVAARLGVDEAALRASVDGRAPWPSTSVITALVRVYGLDPAWVLTGEYDPATHRVALESARGELDAFVRRMIADQAKGSVRDMGRHWPGDAEAH